MRLGEGPFSSSGTSLYVSTLVLAWPNAVAVVERQLTIANDVSRIPANEGTRKSARPEIASWMSCNCCRLDSFTTVSLCLVTLISFKSPITILLL